VIALWSVKREKKLDWRISKQIRSPCTRHLVWEEPKKDTARRTRHPGRADHLAAAMVKHWKCSGYDREDLQVFYLDKAHSEPCLGQWHWNSCPRRDVRWFTGWRDEPSACLFGGDSLATNFVVALRNLFQRWHSEMWNLSGTRCHLCMNAILS
jgi:hypothetical protein